MRNKRIIWGFPGCGKSTIADGKRIIDADCMLFQYIGATEQKLHGNVDMNVVDNPLYPDNYIEYVNEVNADIVFINCHLGLLDKFKNVEIVYPAKDMKEEFLERYRLRGDHSSFIQYMNETFDDMLVTIIGLPYKKHQLDNEKRYIKDIIIEDMTQSEEGKVKNMAGFVTKKELVEVIEQANKFNVFSFDKEKTAEEIAQSIFEGEIIIDLDKLKNDTEQVKKTYGKEYIGYYSLISEKEIITVSVEQKRDAVWVLTQYDEKEDQYYGFKLAEKEERFKDLLNEGYIKTNDFRKVGTIVINDLDGYTQEEAEDIVMDALATGVIEVRHGQILPYHYGFEVKYNNAWYKVDRKPFEIPNELVKRIMLNKEEGHPFESRIYRYADISIQELKNLVEEKQYEMNGPFTPYKETKEYARKQANSYERGLIANYRDLNNKYALDGIIEGRCGGDYSSMTTSGQNDWMRACVALRGYCLDYVVDNPQLPYREEIMNYYAARGLDLRNPEIVNQWIKNNRKKCFYEENRVRPALDKTIQETKEKQNYMNEEKTVEVQIKGNRYNLSFDFEDAGDDYKKWHNFYAASVENPETDNCEIQINQEFGCEPNYKIIIYTPDEDGLMVGYWEALEDVIEDPKELDAIIDIVTDWSDQLIGSGVRVKEDMEL